MSDQTRTTIRLHQAIRHLSSFDPGYLEAIVNARTMCLADSFDGVDDETMLNEYQAWYDRYAPGVFEVIAVDDPEEPGPVTMYYLIPRGQA